MRDEEIGQQALWIYLIIDLSSYTQYFRQFNYILNDQSLLSKNETTTKLLGTNSVYNSF